MNCAYRQEVQRTVNKQSRMHCDGHVHILTKVHHLSTFKYVEIYQMVLLEECTGD